MVDGFWIGQMKALGSTGGFVAMFRGGKIFGGDSAFCFIGTYYSDATSVKAKVTVQNFDPAVLSMFGVKGDYELEVSATISGDSITGTAMLAGQPSKSMAIRLDKKANF
jgi:hypothetical protein